jgi:hypothetical protein
LHHEDNSTRRLRLTPPLDVIPTIGMVIPGLFQALLRTFELLATNTLLVLRRPPIHKALHFWEISLTTSVRTMTTMTTLTTPVTFTTITTLSMHATFMTIMTLSTHVTFMTMTISSPISTT